ncbi:MAG: type II toxin-antitoxin system PemK/MazF family toxin [Parvibaculaceae bacterium]
MPTSDGSSLEQGDVVVVPFPYVDRLAEKRRPAVVVSSPLLLSFNVIWIAMITSARNRPWPSDVTIDSLERAGLPAASIVRPAKIACIEPDRIVRAIGRIDKRELSTVLNTIGRYLGL